MQRFRFDHEVELGGKTDRTHHPQQIIGKGFPRFQGRLDSFLFQVLQSAERINDHAIVILIQAYRKGIDAMVSPGSNWNNAGAFPTRSLVIPSEADPFALINMPYCFDLPKFLSIK